jgi:uncharacterized protein (TIGR02266 family)
MVNSRPVQERRLHARFRVHVDVHYQTAVVAASAPAHDLSPGGIFVETTVPLPVGTRLTVRPVLDPADGIASPTLAGRVVRVVEHGTEAAVGAAAGMGVHFDRLSARERDELLAVVRKHAPPDIVADLEANAAALARAPGAPADTLVDMKAPTPEELEAAAARLRAADAARAASSSASSSSDARESDAAASGYAEGAKGGGDAEKEKKGRKRR